MRNKLSRFAPSRAGVFLTVLVGAIAVPAANSFAAATYGISGISSTITSDLGTDVPIVLALVGGLLVLTVVVRMIRKFVRA